MTKDRVFSGILSHKLLICFNRTFEILLHVVSNSTRFLARFKHNVLMFMHTAEIQIRRRRVTKVDAGLFHLRGILTCGPASLKSSTYTTRKSFILAWK